MSLLSFEELAVRALDAMETAARAGAHSGVAVIAFAPGEAFTSWQSQARVVDRVIDPPNPANLAKEPGANLLAIACAKATEMAVTHQPSGQAGRKTYLGELGWKGGEVARTADGYWIAAFSGAPAETDVLLSQAGLKAITDEA